MNDEPRFAPSDIPERRPHVQRQKSTEPIPHVCEEHCPSFRELAELKGHHKELRKEVFRLNALVKELSRVERDDRNDEDEDEPLSVEERDLTERFRSGRGYHE